jgi:hypothetical protein
MSTAIQYDIPDAGKWTGILPRPTVQEPFLLLYRCLVCFDLFAPQYTLYISGHTQEPRLTFLAKSDESLDKQRGHHLGSISSDLEQA